MKLSRHTLFPLLARVAVAGTALTMAGCGTGSGAQNPLAISNGTGRATLTVRWPERRKGRLVPLAANSINIKVTKGAYNIAQQKSIPRPPSGGITTVDFERIPTGTLSVYVSAHPESDGSGTSLAEAGAFITVSNGQVTPLRLTMYSLIDTIEIVAPETGALGIGKQRKYTAVAKSTYQEIVMTHPDNLIWTITNPAIATVAADGTVTGIAQGQTHLDVREIESGKTQSVVLEVR